MANDKNNRKEKTQNQNIQVFVRVRPVNQKERESKFYNCIDVAGTKEVHVKLSNTTNHTKKFTFDRSFGPLSEQVEVYQEVVSPLIEEVLAGYNCTVFAYGQTGTGKTHTMVGENSGGHETRWQDDPLAGIIPRALSQLFDELRVSNTEYNVRVSYLELYNEELFDLLSSSEDNSKLRIYEDITRKGSNIVNGLEEITVYNKNEVYKIMEQGQEKKRVASTLLNAQSSRSHTVFTIVVHMKENSPEGEELVKIGKLNLVDLAGSENISKAGSDNPAKKERARECVNINQSLLTLGRVITALVERHPHIPYRESKLTRLLQESLGGRTKTSIIATISPGHKDMEETLSTLEYAHRARNIQNKPEINQKVTKKAVLKEYSEEIDRLKRDLIAAREKNGVYLANETYEEMTSRIEHQDKEIQDILHALKALKDEKERFESIFKEMDRNLKNAEQKIEKTTAKLTTTQHQLANTKNQLTTTKELYEEQKVLVTTHATTEEVLTGQAQEILSVADVATAQLHVLHENVDKRRQVESANLSVTQQFGSSSQGQRKKLHDRLNSFSTNITDQLASLRDTYDKQHTQYQRNFSDITHLSEDFVRKLTEALEQPAIPNGISEEDETNSKKRRLNESQEDSRDMILHHLQQFSLQTQEVINSNKISVASTKTAVNEWEVSCVSHLDALVEEQEQWWEKIYAQNKLALDTIAKDLHEQKEQSKKEIESLKQQLEAMDDGFNMISSKIQSIRGEKDKVLESFETSSENRTTFFDNQLNSHKKIYEESCKYMEEFDSKFKESVKQKKEAVGVLGDILVRKSQDCHRVVSDRVEDIGNTFKSLTDLTKANLNKIQETSKSLSETIEQDMSSHIETTQSLARSVTDFKDNVEQQLTSYDLMETNFLHNQFSTYSPTGRTPIRQEFRYPRQLVATSPHERIIQRFRQARSIKVEQECIELDDTSEDLVINNDDSSSACSSANSSTTFAEPAPPKSLADTDKENVLSASDTSISSQNSDTSVGSQNPPSKYQSKLRPPQQSQKRVLSEKN